MTGFILRRIGQSIVVVLLVTLITFLLLHALPEGPARAILGNRATPAAIAAFNKAGGYDRPVWYQYFHYLNQLRQGQLGFSYAYNEPVSTLIGNNLPKTVYLVGLSTVIALVIAVPLGVFQAVKRNSVADYILTALSFIFYSTPVFFLGLVLVLIFAVYTHLLPAEAPQGTSFGAILGDPKAMILPIATLVALTVASFSRYMRSSMLENIAQDYVRTARAKGVGEQRVLYRHMLRNSLIPIVTLLGLSLPGILAGALITEVVFNFPGMGLLFYTAVQRFDYPIMLAITLLTGVATVVGNLLADVTYALLDPRVRLS